MLHGGLAQERDLPLLLECDRRMPDPDAPGAGVWGTAIGYGKGVLGAPGRGVIGGVMGKGLSGVWLRASWATVSRMAAKFSMLDGWSLLARS